MLCPATASYTKQSLFTPQLFEPSIFSSHIDKLSNHHLLMLREKIEEIANNARREADGRYRNKQDVLRKKLAVQQMSCGIVAAVWNLGFCINHLFSPSSNDYCGRVAHVSGNGLLLCLFVKEFALLRFKIANLAKPHIEKNDQIDRVFKVMNGIIGQRCESAKRRSQSVFELDIEAPGIGQLLSNQPNSPNNGGLRIAKIPFMASIAPIFRN